MSLYASSNSQTSTFKNVPSGLHLARCYRIVDLGTQKSEYDGKTNFSRKVMICWEIHGEDSNGEPLCTDKGEPMAIFKTYTLSLNDKASLRIDLQAWRGRAFTQEELNRFDLKNVLGHWCMVNVIQKPVGDKVYSNVASLAPVPQVVKSSGLPDGHNKLDIFNIAEPDMKLFETFGKNIKHKIESSPEWKARGNTGLEEHKEWLDAYDGRTHNDLDDKYDLPF